MGAFVWLISDWHEGVAVLPLSARIAFVMAAFLFCMPASTVAEVAAKQALAQRWRRALLDGAQWYCFMVVAMNVRLPSAEAAIWLLSALGFGALQALIQPRPQALLAEAAPFPRDWRPMAFPALVWVLAAVLSLAPIIKNTATALFILIVAMGSADEWRAGIGPGGIRWPMVIQKGLGLLALVIGLFTASF